VDTDDDVPTSFQLFYHTDSITAANLTSASKITIPNKYAADSAVTFEAAGLLGLTK
jgi:hypothetical protein